LEITINWEILKNKINFNLIEQNVREKRYQSCFEISVRQVSVASYPFKQYNKSKLVTSKPTVYAGPT